jgi:hypothetical protein
LGSKPASTVHAKICGWLGIAHNDESDGKSAVILYGIFPCTHM